MTESLDRLRAALADRYTVERELGRGGTATVYLATDLRHDRPVAVKVLQPELAAVLGPERFLREIQISARLTHPHILPLHDSGEADGFLYCVMPYVAGESLRERLQKEKQLPLEDALRIAREVADALSYAHAQGVVHRDIKPENILLESGHAVVADFGIARAIDVAGGERLTETGIAIGTPAYMSPEQASGSHELDGRSDLYSLGCVLYEMLAGVPPFAGPTAQSLLHQHLATEPPSVTSIRPSVPGWVAAALTRSLAKTPAARFNPVAQFGEAISPRVPVTDSDAWPLPAAQGRRWWFVPGVLAAALLIVLAVVLSRVMAGGPITITASNIIPVTSEPGVEFQPALSPDGSDVAYVVGPLGNSRIVVRGTRDLGTGGESRLGEGDSGLHWLPSWTPEGASLRFFACQGGGGTGFGSDCDWKVVGTRGGSVRSVGVPRRSSSYAWSRDGTRVAFVVWDSIFAFSADRGEPELLSVHVADAFLPLHSPAWSPDGRRIAYVVGNSLWRTTQNAMGSSIWILDVNGGERVRVTNDEYLNVSPQWLPDSRHLLFVSSQDGPRGIYVVEVGADGPRGSPRSVLPSSDAHSISIAADGRKLAYARSPSEQNIWSIAIRRSGVVSIRDAVPVTTGNQLIENHGLSPDGDSIVYESTLLGNTDIYKRSLTSERATLIADLPGYAFSPQWSPDGSEIAFHAMLVGLSRVRIFVVPAAGGVADFLKDMPGDDGYPVWSPDGLTIGFQSFVPGTPEPRLWLVSRDRVGGAWRAPRPVTDFRCAGAQWDPDGTSLVCLTNDSTGGALVRVSSEGEVLARYDPSAAGFRDFMNFKFSPDGSRIYFPAIHADGSQGVWWIPANGGNATKIVAFDDPSLTVFGDLTVGPEHLYLTIAQYESNIWVMDLEW